MTKNAGDILADAAETFRQRNAVYKDNFIRIGNVMKALFPDGLEMRKATDWTRLYFTMLCVTKLTRYVANWEQGGHKDSVHDIIVYAALLEAFDATIRPPPPPPEDK